MTIFHLNALGTASVTTASWATDSLTDAIKEDNAALGTVAVAASTTIALTAQNNINVETTKYVESLSDSEIARYIEMIEQKSEELERREIYLDERESRMDSSSNGRSK